MSIEKKVMERLKRIAEHAAGAAGRVEKEDWSEALDCLTDLRADLDVAERGILEIVDEAEED